MRSKRKFRGIQANLSSPIRKARNCMKQLKLKINFSYGIMLFACLSAAAISIQTPPRFYSVGGSIIWIAALLQYRILVAYLLRDGHVG